VSSFVHWHRAPRGVRLHVVSVDVVEVVDSKVAAELAVINGRLEQLIADAVDREIARLVSELLEVELEARAAGKAREHGPEHRDVVEVDEPMKVCRSCGETKPLHSFHAGKAICKICRNRQDRERKAARRQRLRAETSPAPLASAGTASPSLPESETAPSSVA
jgi:hypothetical protein